MSRLWSRMRPVTSDENWQEIQRQGLPTPKFDELIFFSDWGAAVNKYGETAGDVPSNLHVDRVIDLPDGSSSRGI